MKFSDSASSEIVDHQHHTCNHGHTINHQHHHHHHHTSEKSSRGSHSASTNTSSIKTFAKAAIKKHKNLLYSREVDILSREPKWVPAEDGLEYLHHDGADLLRQTLSGKLYIF